MRSRPYKQPNNCVHTSKYTAWTYMHTPPCSHACSLRVMARLLVANHVLREYCFHVKRLHSSRPNGLTCMNASTKLVCTYGYMYEYMYACMYVFTALWLLVRCPSRVCACPPAVHHHAYLLSWGYISCMYVCSTRCMYASTALFLFVPHFPVVRARPLARRTSSRLLVIARIPFMHVCVLDARYVRCRRVSHARAMSARFSSLHARPPFMNTRSPVARCSLCSCIHAYTSSKHT